MQFPLRGLRDSPAKEIMFRAVTGISVVLLLVVVGIGLVGMLPWTWFAGFGGMFIAVTLFRMLWLLMRTGGGFAEITESHLLVKANGGNESYPLEDIADVCLKRAWWGRVPYVELQLRRAIRLGIWRNVRGTDIAGVPTLFRKRAVIIVEDTEGFAEALRGRLFMEFRLVRNSPIIWAITRALILLVLSVMALCFSLALAGNMDWDDALVLALLPALVPIVYYWALRSAADGVVAVTPTHLIVHTQAAKQVYPWEDITDITIAKLREMSQVRRVYASILRLDPNFTLVLVRLARLVKKPLYPWKEWGTRALGIPTLTKMLELDIEDKQGFVQEARRHLRR